MIQHRVPTLPTPTTLRAMSHGSNCSSRYRRSVSSVRRYCAMRLPSCAMKAVRSASPGSSSSTGTSSGGSEMIRGCPSTTRVSLATSRMLSLVRALAMPSSSRLRWRTRELGVEVGPQLVHVGAGVPDVQVGHGREAAHREPVAGDRRRDDVAALLGREPVVPRRHLQAGGQPLDIPLPRARQGLVEVVDVEHQAALGGAEDAEVGQVRVTARLHRQPGDRRGGQVAGHRQGRPTVVGERGDQHPAPADRHQFGHPGDRLLLQQGDRVGPVRGRLEYRVAGTGDRRPGRLAPGGALRRGQPHAGRCPAGTAGRAGAEPRSSVQASSAPPRCCACLSGRHLPGPDGVPEQQPADDLEYAHHHEPDTQQEGQDVQ